MAPEQVEGREADARSDIWACGVVLYEMATGQRPCHSIIEDVSTSPVTLILNGKPKP